MSGLTGKVVLVTGAGAGIGAATAQELASRGALLALADVNTGGLEHTAAALPGDPLLLPLDITDSDACAGAVAETVERFGGLDVVWANAGIASFGPVLHTSPEAWKRTLDVNLVGTFNTVRPALPALIERRGYVAITASLASFAAAPMLSAYSASKSGVESFANALRTEIAHLGVEVGTIHPTWLATAMVEEPSDQMRAYNELRASVGWPLKKTYPVEKAVPAIADGIERRARRICIPRWVRALHVLRSAATTRFFERDQLRAVPEMDRLFAEDVAARGADAASVTEATRKQVL